MGISPHLYFVYFFTLSWCHLPDLGVRQWWHEEPTASLLSFQVLPNHGLHATGFIAAFLISLVLTLVALFFLAKGRCLQGSLLARCRVSLPPRDALVGSGVSWTFILPPDVSQLWTMSEHPGHLRTDAQVCFF